jgi:hypothetical protein
MSKKKKSNESPKLIVRVPPATLNALKSLALGDRRNLSEYVRLALQDHIKSKQKKGTR